MEIKWIHQSEAPLRLYGVWGENQKQEKQIDSSIYLMRNITCPGVLVECGFLSNAAETQLLRENTYQNKLALTIAAGYLQHQFST